MTCCLKRATSSQCTIFDFDKGKYIHDYIELLQGDLPSEFHIEYNEENYQRMKEVIDRRYKEWKSPRRVGGHSE